MMYKYLLLSDMFGKEIDMIYILCYLEYNQLGNLLNIGN